jgi:hypothetical protein
VIRVPLVKCRDAQGSREYRVCIRCEESCGEKLELNEGNELRKVTLRGQLAPRQSQCNRITSTRSTLMDGHRPKSPARLF